MTDHAETAGGAGGDDPLADRRFAVDCHVGRRLRQRRMLLGLSQERLAASLGLTFQQIQKYERGANRIGAARLFDLSRRLEVPIGYFFDGLQDPGPDSGEAEGAAPQADPPPAAVAPRREIADLIRAYYRIKDPRMRGCMLELCRAMAAAPFGTRRRDGALLT